MKHKPDKKRLKEIEHVYRSLGLQSKTVRKYLSALGTPPGYTEEEQKIIFIEAGTTSSSSGEFTNA